MTEAQEAAHEAAIRGLAGCLAFMVYGKRQRSDACYTYAKAILADPQALMDALEETGIVERRMFDLRDIGYRVIPPEPPHAHDWRVWIADELITFRCRTCPEQVTQPNDSHVPLMWPTP